MNRRFTAKAGNPKLTTILNPEKLCFKIKGKRFSQNTRAKRMYLPYISYKPCSVGNAPN
jgi:hypothetical protein